LIFTESHAGSEIESHFHDWYEFGYMIEGEQDFTIKNEKFEIGVGDFLMVNSMDMHGRVNKTDCEKYTLLVNDQFIKRLVPEIDLKNLHCNTTTIQSAEEYYLYKKIIETYLRCVEVFLYEDKNKEIVVRALLMILFYQMSLLDNARTSDFSQPSNLVESYIADEIVGFIKLNYHLGITINDIAQHFNYSDAYISKLIKERTGLTFLQFLNELRLRHAVFEITYTNKKLVEICYDSGFGNSKSFINTFKAKHGVTPKDYRANLKNELANKKPSTK